MYKLGYACINTELQKQGIGTNRTMRKKTFEEKGLSYVSELALKNAEDLIKILQWNQEHGITFFRISSGILPWYGLYNVTDLPDYDKIMSTLREAGDYATHRQHRLTTHPDHFVKMASKNKDVVHRAIIDLEMHGFVFDAMGLSRTPYNKINIHIGQGVGELRETAKRFLDNIQYLPESVITRLTVENDDKKGLYSILDLYELLYSRDKNIPLVLDTHHHLLHNKGLTLTSAYELAQSTWPTDICPVVHHSSSKQLYENDSVKEQAHADFIYECVEFHLPYERPYDILLEAKSKEQAVLKYKKEFCKNV